MIRPLHTLRDLFKSGVIFAPRASLNHGGWMTHDANLLETMAGAYLLVRGSLPMLIHRDSFPSQYLALYDGLLELETGSLRSYADECDYQALLGEIIRKSESTVVQHRYPESELPASTCHVPPALLGLLNNKARLEEWVPAPWLLPRRVIFPTQTGYEEPQTWPQVLKAAGSMTSGGGADVRICRNPDDWRRAVGDFAGAEALILEKYQAPRQILGVQFVAADSGEIHDLGCTENELTSQGYVNGNWIDAKSEASLEMKAVGRQIMEKAVRAGYRGVAGIDFLIADDGRFWVIDLNFRCNAGTPGLLLSASIHREWKCSTMFSTIVSTMLPTTEFFHLLRKGIEDRWLLPLGGYFPVSGPPQMAAILFLGNDRNEVKARRKEWGRRLRKPRRSWWRFWR